MIACNDHCLKGMYGLFLAGGFSCGSDLPNQFRRYESSADTKVARRLDRIDRVGHSTDKTFDLSFEPSTPSLCGSR